MAQYDVFKSPDGKGYWLDVQSDLLDVLNTRMIVPLLHVSDAPKQAAYLNPVFDFAGGSHVMMTQFMSAVPIKDLSETMYNLSDESDRITRALDMLLHGF